MNSTTPITHEAVHEEDNGDGEDDDDSADKEFEDTDNEEENVEDSDNEEGDNYKFLDSSLLEDEEPSVSIRVDSVKGKGAGRKPNKGQSAKTQYIQHDSC